VAYVIRKREVRSSGTCKESSSGRSDLALSFDKTVLAALSPLERCGGLKVYDLNTYGMIDEIVGDPSALGVANATDPVWTGNFSSSTSGTLVSKNPAVQNTYLFWDELHPTEAGHRLAATFAYDELTTGTSNWATTAGGFAAIPGPHAAMSIR